MRSLKSSLCLILFCFSAQSFAGEPQPSQRFKTLKPLVLIAEYNLRSNKTVSKETAKAYLEIGSKVKMSYTAFATSVPPGTIMTIIGKAPKPWYLYFNDDYYLIKLDPDPARGLDVKIQLSLGMEGQLDGLNPEIFSRVD